MSGLLDEGFKKADAANIPAVTEEMIYDFISKLSRDGTKVLSNGNQNEDYSVDCVQVRRKEICALKGRLFYPKESDTVKFKVVLLVNERLNEIISVNCENCCDGICRHALAFLFWTHRRNNDCGDNRGINRFWGCETGEHLKNIPVAMQTNDNLESS